MAARIPFGKLVAEAASDGVKQLVVAAVVHYYSRILLLQRPADEFMVGIFELPSGKVEDGEHLDEALLREVKAETGREITAIAHYLDSFDYTSVSGKKARQFNFAVDVDAPEPVVLTEHESHTWISIEDEPPVTDSVKDVLKRFQQLAAAQGYEAPASGR